jgi:heme/copper-type cytochrome/quinol oxidase subunit 3
MEEHEPLKDELLRSVEEKQKLRKARGQMVYFAIIGSGLFFTALSIVFLSFLSDGDIPVLPTFHYSALVAVFSSLALHAAYHFSKENQIHKVSQFIKFGTFNGAFFIVLQVFAIGQLVVLHANDGIRTNSTTLFIIIATVHLLHLAFALALNIILTRRNKAFKIHSKSNTLLRGTTFFWDFLGAVWLFFYAILIF